MPGNGFDEIAPEDEEFIALVAEHFDPRKYLELNTDVANAGIDPLEHWLNHGVKEGRQLSPHMDICWGGNADSSPDRTWKGFYWRGEPVAVRVRPRRADNANQRVRDHIGAGHFNSGNSAHRFGALKFVRRIGHALRHGLWRRATSALPKITLVGSPFGTSGRSEHIRTIWRALQSASVSASLYDVLGHVPEKAVFAEMGQRQVDEIGDGIRIFHLNGNEIQIALRKIEGRQSGFFQKGYNVVAPRGSCHGTLPCGRESSIASMKSGHRRLSLRRRCGTRSRFRFLVFAMPANRMSRHCWISRILGFRRTVSLFFFSSICTHSRLEKIPGRLSRRFAA